MQVSGKPRLSRLSFKPALIFNMIAIVAFVLSACTQGTPAGTAEANAISTAVQQTSAANQTQAVFQTMAAQLTQVSSHRRPR